MSVTAGPEPVESGPECAATVTVSSMLMRVSVLASSIAFYCDVFGCRVTVEGSDAALLLAPDGFQIYLHADASAVPRPLTALGVREVMWATATREALDEVGDRMRRHYPATYSHSFDGVSFVDGRDPDGNRVLVAHPNPLQLPRFAISERFR